MKLNIKILFIFILMLFSQNIFSQSIKSLDKRKFIAWTVDHMPYHILVEDAIIDYNSLNVNEKNDKVSELEAEDLLIIIQQKKSTKKEIHELWYGNGLSFNVISREKVDQVLSQDIQQALINKKQYLNNPSDIVFFKSDNQRLLASYSSKLSLWKQHNFIISTEGLYLRSDLLQYSANFATGNSIVGLPGKLFASTAMGIGTRNSEIGIRFPAKLPLPISIGNNLKDSRLLRENLGLYSKITIDNIFSTGATFHAQMGFDFYPRSTTIANDTTFFKSNNIEKDNRYVNLIDVYALFATSFEAPIKIPYISRINFTPGFHYIKVVHKTRGQDEGQLYERTFYVEDGIKYSYGEDNKSFTKSFGLYGRIDVMSDIGYVPSFIKSSKYLGFIKISNVPLFEVSFQHITKMNTVASLTTNINDNVSFLISTYTTDQNGIVSGGWLPNKNIWLGVRYRSDF